jgi:hypothetical protein
MSAIYNISSNACKPDITTYSTGADPEGWRLFWNQQSRVDGTDWITLIAAAQSALTKLRLVHGVSS